MRDVARSAWWSCGHSQGCPALLFASSKCRAGAGKSPHPLAFSALWLSTAGMARMHALRGAWAWLEWGQRALKEVV